MTRGKMLSIAACVTVVGLLLTSCAPAIAPEATVQPKTALKTESPVAKPSAAPTAPSLTPKAATETPKYGGVMLMSHNGDPPSYDPIQESILQSTTLVFPSYSGAVQHDPLEPTKVISDLAEKWEISPDGMTYTFHLYKDVKWHDGAPFSSEDARYSFELIRKPPKGITSPRQEWLKAADRIEAPDKNTLRITLLYPSAAFLDNLGDGRLVFVPKHVYESKGSMKKDVVGTGPYKFKSHDAGISWSIVKNPDYFIKGRPYLDGITWYIIPDVGTRFAALRTRRVHVSGFGTPGMTPAQADAIRKELSDKVTVQRYPGLVFHAFWMPHTKAPWSDIRVRRAIDLAIDRQNVIKVAMEGGAEMGSYMPPGAWSLPKDELEKMPGYRQPKEADIAEAKRLLAEAGYAQGIKTTTITRNLQQLERGALSVKDQLAPLGIEVTVRITDQATLNDLLYKRSFDTAFFTGSVSYEDPDQVFGQQFIAGVPRNYADFSDEKIERWYDEQSRAMDPAKRKQIVLDIQRRLHELVPAAMLLWASYDLSYWKEVRDLKAGIGIFNNLKWQNVWLAQP